MSQSKLGVKGALASPAPQDTQGSPQPLAHPHNLCPNLALDFKVLVSAETKGKQGEENSGRAKNCHSKNSSESIAGSFARK